MNPSPRPSRPAARPCGTHPAPAPALTMRPGSLPVADADPVAPVRRALPDMLPDSLRESTFARLDPDRAPEAYRVCQEYADQESYQGRQGLLLYGRRGAGKSSLAAAILHQTIARSHTPHYAAFWPVACSLQVVRDTEFLPRPYRVELTDLLDQPLPILDQLGGPTSLWEASHLEELLRLLRVRPGPTVVTTDLSICRLRQALGDFWVEELLKWYHPVRVGR